MKPTTQWKTVEDSGRELLSQAHKAAMTPLSIYLSGETGSGKEVLAWMIHSWSDRANQPFIPLHCGALPESLAESELFGHIKGSFTGASSARTGALLQAHNGTLFLDEVAELSLELQVKLLRFLESGEIRPVGSDHLRHSSVRLICATHKPLQELVRTGKFRMDLYYRLASITLEIPALRERPRDVALLAEEYAATHSKTLSLDAIAFLQSRDWQGNVRELRHSLERACGFSSSEKNVIEAVDFSFLKPESGELHEIEKQMWFESAALPSMHEMEKILLTKALQASNGHRGEAAKLLGVARSTVFEMLKRHKMPGLFRAMKSSSDETREKHLYDIAL